MKTKNKKIFILSFMLILFVFSVSADWNQEGADFGRTFTSSGDFNSSLATTANFTCGTNHDSAFQPIQPLIGAWDNTNNLNDILLSCSADSGNSNAHLIMLSDEYDVFDATTITSSLGDAVKSTYVQPVSWFEYDGDNNTEFVVMHVGDTGLTDVEVSLIVYEFDLSTKQLTKEFEHIIFNNSVNVTQNDGTNYTLGSIISSDNSEYTLQCVSSTTPRCFGYLGNFMFSTNLSENNTVEWAYTPADINSNIGGLDKDALQHLIPTVTQLNTSNIYEAVLVGDDTFVTINMQNGSITRNFTISVSGTAGFTYQITDCNGSRCEDGRSELFVGSRDGTIMYGQMYDTLDGDILHTVSDIVSNTPDLVYTWVEDRANNTIPEICIISIDTIGATDRKLKCEQMDTFQFDTIDVTLEIDATEDNHDFNPIIADINGDEFNDIIIGAFVYELPQFKFSGSVNYTDIIFSTSGIDNSMVHVFSQVSDSSAGDLLSFSGTAEDDTYFITSSSTAISEVAQLNLPEFTDTQVQPISQNIGNPICNYSTVEFSCTIENGCYTDVEYDRIGLCYDCFGDGTQAGCFNSTEYFLNFETWSCDLDNKSGIQTMTVEIFEDGFEEYNTSTLHNYIVDDDACFNETNIGFPPEVSVNLPPEFIGVPSANTPQPFCRDSTIVFSCEEGVCYEDNENDTVYFAVDCDADGTTDIISSVGTETFYCNFDYSAIENGTQQVSVQIYDLAHTTSIDSLSFSITISPYTQFEAIEDGNLICSSPNFFDSEGNIIVDALDGQITPLFDVGDPCESNSECTTTYCNRGYCALKLGRMVCSNNSECLSSECKNDKCTKPDYWDLIDASKDEMYGDSSQSNNFLALTILIVVAGAIMVGAGNLAGVIGGILAFVTGAIFFTIAGWLSVFILFGIFLVLIVSAVFVAILGMSGE